MLLKQEARAALVHGARLFCGESKEPKWLAGAFPFVREEIVVLVLKYFVVVGACLLASLWIFSSAPSSTSTQDSSLEATLHQLAGAPDMTTFPSLSRGLRAQQTD